MTRPPMWTLALAPVLVVAGVALIAIQHPWRQPAPCNDPAFSMAVLRSLPSDAELQEKAERDRLRAWATSLPVRCVREKYLEWISHYENKAAGRVGVDNRWERAGALVGTFPSPPPRSER